MHIELKMRENNGRLCQIFLLHYVQTTFHSSYITGGGHIVTYTTYWFIKEYTEGKNRDKEKWKRKLKKKPFFLVFLLFGRFFFYYTHRIVMSNKTKVRSFI